MVAGTARRRSPRLDALDLKQEPGDDNLSPKTTKKGTKVKKPAAKVPRPKKATTRKTIAKKEEASADQKKPISKTIAKEAQVCSEQKKSTSKNKIVEDILPRTREEEIKQEISPEVWVMGIDEAGRGPLAGPVVAAAAVVPAVIKGITDSKKITCESTREELYEAIIASSDVSWAVAVVDAQRIDEINILQATMQAMSMAASALVCDSSEAEAKWNEMVNSPACASRLGCYVACGGKMLKAKASSVDKSQISSPTDGEEKPSFSSKSYYALVDGNRVPKDLPCQGESIVKGDSKEYSIAAASILAKVTRDRLMHAYAKLYPEYNLAQHKGYPTKSHMAAVFEFGASPIHRRSFAPLKHMVFDENGKIVEESTD